MSPARLKILVSAGEASGDRYAAELVAALRRRFPAAAFFGAVGPRLRAQGVRAVVRTESLAVVGIVEVLRHVPRIYGEFRRLVAAAARERPDLAILTDAPDFNLRVAKRLRRQGCPVAYYVAPQMWAWRRWRVRKLRAAVDRLLCIFPFEEDFFRKRGVATTFVGHPLASEPETCPDRDAFFRRAGLKPDVPLLALLPGSRPGEAGRHLPELLEAVRRLRRRRELHVVVAASSTTGAQFFRERISEPNVLVVENDTQSVLACADVALIASGTATVEAALQATPMVVFYRVHPATWAIGRPLVRVPFLSMVNLLAGERIVSELIQSECRADRLADEAEKLLADTATRLAMKRDLRKIRTILEGSKPAAERAAEVVCEQFLNHRI